MEFVIRAASATGATALLRYDNATSELTYADGRPVVESAQVRPWGTAVAVSRDEPGRKGAIRTLKISLGLACNYACPYCSQRFVQRAEETTRDDIEAFVRSLPAWFDGGDDGQGAGARIEFWGGEPFVYWKTLKPLAERLRALYPQAEFHISTNGALLDAEKNAWLDRLGFVVGLSHDGPGQPMRGADPMDDPEKREAILDLWRRLRPQGRISVNAMVHRGNRSRAAIQRWMEARFGPDGVIGEGAFIDPYDEGGLAASLADPADALDYRRQAFAELRAGLASRFDIARRKIMDFVESIRRRRPATALGQKCGMDRADTIAVDLRGNVLTCQNVSAQSTAPNGEPHRIGHVSDLSAVRLTTATHWSKRAECPKCPVLQLCKGACMFLEGKLWERGCENAFSDNVPFFAAGIEYLTGLVPYYIEGPQREDRRDVFGLVHGLPKVERRRVIPIRAHRNA